MGAEELNLYVPSWDLALTANPLMMIMTEPVALDSCPA